MHIMDVLNLVGVILAFAALLIAWWTLKVTKQSVERARIDWARQKWFDLYFKADQAYNALEEYQALYQGCNPAICSPEQEKDHNKLMDIFREACTMAVVFPKNPAIDSFCDSVKFTNVSDALSKERLEELSDALELLRQKALINRGVLNVESADA
jgi:hypothetical protein